MVVDNYLNHCQRGASGSLRNVITVADPCTNQDYFGCPFALPKSHGRNILLPPLQSGKVERMLKLVLMLIQLVLEELELEKLVLMLIQLVLEELLVLELLKLVLEELKLEKLVLELLKSVLLPVLLEELLSAVDFVQSYNCRNIAYPNS